MHRVFQQQLAICVSVGLTKQRGTLSLRARQSTTLFTSEINGIGDDGERYLKGKTYIWFGRRRRTPKSPNILSQISWGAAKCFILQPLLACEVGNRVAATSALLIEFLYVH